MRTVAVPDRSAAAAVNDAAFFTAAPAFSIPGATADDPTVRNTATAAAATIAVPVAVTPTRRRREPARRARGSSPTPAIAIRCCTAAAAASTVWTKVSLLRGPEVRRPSAARP
jgi:hypothetical protein